VFAAIRYIGTRAELGHRMAAMLHAQLDCYASSLEADMQMSADPSTPPRQWQICQARLVERSVLRHWAVRLDVEDDTAGCADALRHLGLDSWGANICSSRTQPEQSDLPEK
jgi:hypothetical protein